MRHTRNRQLAKLHNEPMWFWNKEGTDDIRLQRHWMKMGLQPKLDSTFKWHRDYGEYWFSHISYGDKDSQYPFWCEIVHIKDWKDKSDKRRWGE
ncbi:hypothetical protein [Bacillus toyonensis]|uniref:hypothetical protein n=1 Tax=Bacillus toyonensis TaxID=155322 RepID=UPI000BEC8E5D|nr:hypothetical protein [Bacillus toyonensis]PEA32961.1 hypothetical protein COO13_11780 [Bacillus toyonensis]